MALSFAFCIFLLNSCKRIIAANKTSLVKCWRTFKAFLIASRYFLYLLFIVLQLNFEIEFSTTEEIFKILIKFLAYRTCQISKFFLESRLLQPQTASDLVNLQSNELEKNKINSGYLSCVAMKADF